MMELRGTSNGIIISARCMVMNGWMDGRMCLLKKPCLLMYKVRY